MTGKEPSKAEIITPDNVEVPKENHAVIGRLQKLTQRRESKEIASTDFNICMWLNYSGGREQPLTRKDLSNEAVVLSSEEFKDIGYLTIKLPSGKLSELDAEDFPDNDFLIIYPEDLG